MLSLLRSSSRRSFSSSVVSGVMSFAALNPAGIPGGEPNRAKLFSERQTSSHRFLTRPRGDPRARGP